MDIGRRSGTKYIFDISNKDVFSTQFIPEMRDPAYAVKVTAFLISRESIFLQNNYKRLPEYTALHYIRT